MSDVADFVQATKGNSDWLAIVGQVFYLPVVSAADMIWAASTLVVDVTSPTLSSQLTVHAHMRVPMNAKKHVLPLLISLVAVGTITSLAATKIPTNDSPLDGKFVLVSQPGVTRSVHGGARFESVGQTDFVVVPMRHTDTTVTYDYWIPLKDVDLLQVFHSKEDADDYIDRRDKRRQAVSDR